MGPMPTVALVVNQDPGTRQAYAQTLRQLACRTVEAEDGREALAKALINRPNVIVTDSHLPGISGVDLCRILRTDAHTQSVPIIVLADSETADDTTLAEAAGADAVLVRPFTPEYLGEQVTAVLGRGNALHVTPKRIAPARVASNDSRLSHRHHRHSTTTPPLAPPALLCLACDVPMKYVDSHIGGVSERHSEQWDHFECGICRTKVEYRQRTRKQRPYVA
jgi:DNA-binding response OmpR family regulator